MVDVDVISTDLACDELLSTVCALGPNYGPVLALEAGVDPAQADHCFRALQDQGLVERVSEEPCYRATELGNQITREALERRTPDSQPADVA